MGAWGVDSAIRSYGADYVMKDIKRVLKPADVAFFNAEGPYSDTGTPATWKDVIFRGNPRLVPAMAKAGVDVVTMANNHCLDYGSAALLDSIRRFNANGIQVVGAGKNYSAAWKVRSVERDGRQDRLHGLDGHHAAGLRRHEDRRRRRRGAHVVGRRPLSSRPSAPRPGRSTSSSPPTTGASRVSTTRSHSRSSRRTPPSTPAPTWS